MENNNNNDAAAGIFGILIWLSLLLLGIYGIYLGFITNFWIGVVHLVFPPLPVITGALYFFFDINLPAGILSAF